MTGTAGSRYFVKALERSLEVMCAFGAGSPEMSLSHVAARTGLTRASARRILLSLVDLGYAEKEGNRFRLRPRVLELSYAYLTSLGLAHRGQYVLEMLTQETGKPCSLSVLDRHEVVYIARSTIPRLASFSVGIGERHPAHAIAMGRVLLAGLEPVELDNYFQTAKIEHLTSKTVVNKSKLRKILCQVRDDGYAYISSEFTLGLEAVAVPVTKPGGRIIAAMNIYADRISGEFMLRDSLTKLRHAAKLLAEG